MTGFAPAATRPRGTMYPVDFLAASARSISLLNTLTGQTDLATALIEDAAEDIVGEVRDDQGERGLLALAETLVLFLADVVDDLTAILGAIPSEAVTDVPACITGLYEQYGQEPRLAERLPALLASAGGHTLHQGDTVRELLAEVQLNNSFILGLAKTTGMVLRLIERNGTPIEQLIGDLEDRAFTLSA